MPTSGVREKCAGLPLLPVDHARRTLSCLAHARVLTTYSWCKRGFAAHSHTLQESALAQRKVFLWCSAPPPLALPTNGTLLLLWVQTSLDSLHYDSTLQTMTHCLPIPSGCLHTDNPSPLPRTDLQSLSLSTQLMSKHLRLWCLGQWHQWFVLISLCFALLSLAAVLVSEAVRPLCINWSPCQLDGF